MIDISDYKGIIYKIIGAAMEVHNTIGSGLLEPIYNECLAIELEGQGIFVEREKELSCYYKGCRLEKKYRMDLVVNGEICLELKSVKTILPEHRIQLFNYLKLTKMPIGILINFGDKQLQGERYWYSEIDNECTMLNKDMLPIYNKIDIVSME